MPEAVEAASTHQGLAVDQEAVEAVAQERLLIHQEIQVQQTPEAVQVDQEVLGLEQTADRVSLLLLTPIHSLR